MTKYCGKYPNRIESSWIVTKTHYENIQVDFPQFTPGMYCRTNCGKIYRYHGDKQNYPTGEVNDDEFTFIEQSTKRS